MDDDSQLLKRMSNGSEAAWAEFYRRHQGRVFRFARQMSGSVALAEEASQEAFLAILQGRVAFDPLRGSVAALLLGVARNKLLRLMSRERYEEPLAIEPAAADTGLEQQGDVGRLRKAIAGLPAHYREPVVLCDLEELTYEEAAAILGCPPGTVRSRLHRARQMLMQRLGKVVVA